MSSNQLNEDDIERVKKAAKEIEVEASDYYLSNAILACEKYIVPKREEYIARLKKDLEKAKDEEDLVSVDKLSKQIKESIAGKRLRIFLQYCDINEKAARVYKDDSGLLVIVPRVLKNRAKESETIIDYDSLRKLRQLIAHELGHIVLHTEDILKTASMQGSLDIKDEKKESEADLFSKYLIDFRFDRRVKDEESYKEYCSKDTESSKKLPY